jgi:hypothetical protein
VNNAVFWRTMVLTTMAASNIVEDCDFSGLAIHVRRKSWRQCLRETISMLLLTPRKETSLLRQWRSWINEVSSLMINCLTEYYITQNNALDLRDAVMDMLATRNRLRADDLQDLTVERFLVNSQTVNDSGFVEGLGYWIYGKSDAEQVMLTAWSEETHPKFDPVLLILCYTYVTGIRAGFLFPNDSFLKSIMVCF